MSGRWAKGTDRRPVTQGLLVRFHEWIIKEIDMNANSAQLDLPTESLAQRWQTLREQQPGLRIRNAAQLLNVSEMELLLAQPEGQVVRLRPQAGDIMQRLDRVGRVMRSEGRRGGKRCEHWRA